MVLLTQQKAIDPAEGAQVVLSRRQARREAAERAEFIGSVLARLREPEGRTLAEILTLARDADEIGAQVRRQVVRAGDGLLGFLGS
jgi:hypothetical protein